jgi:hypothetical protein
MDRNKDIENPDHERQLLAQRKSAREQRLMVNLLALSPRAHHYLEGLETKQVNARVHLRKIVALAELHGKEAITRALDDGLELHAFSAEYIANSGYRIRNPGARSSEKIISRISTMNMTEIASNQVLRAVRPTASCETIYCAIYAMPRCELRSEFVGLLRKSRKTCLPRTRGTQRKGRLPDMTSMCPRLRWLRASCPATGRTTSSKTQ